MNRNLDTYSNLVHVKLVSSFTAVQSMFTSIMKNFELFNSKFFKIIEVLLYFTLFVFNSLRQYL